MIASSNVFDTGISEVVIVGAGGFGRELANYARDAQLTICGFLDDHKSGSVNGVQVLGDIESVEVDHRLVRFVIAVGDAVTRGALAGRVLARGGELAQVIHPTAYIAQDAKLGAGVIVGPFGLVGRNARLGDNVVLNAYASIGHDAIVGAHSVLSPYSAVTGQAIVEEEVFLGTHAVVVPRRRIGRRTKVAAGAIVTNDVDVGHLVVGNPARGRAIFSVPNE